jgi:hypothetical protein
MTPSHHSEPERRRVIVLDQPRPQPRRLSASNALDGMAVLDRAGARVGSIRYIILDMESGCAELAVLTLGGLFPIGERLYPLPWKELRYRSDDGTFEADLHASRLRHAPSFPRGEEPEFDEAYQRRIRRFYGA